MSGQSIAERSLKYKELAQIFFYPEPEAEQALAQDGLKISAHAYMESFDQAISKKACSLYEGSYNTAERNTLFEELLRFYSFFGLHRTEEAELPDHLGVELEFMHYLSFLEYNALQRGEDILGLQRAQKDFLERHVLITIGGVCANFKASDEAYKACVNRAHEFIRDDLNKIENAIL